MQCQSWMDAGWRTSKLNLTAEHVTFQRSNNAPPETKTSEFKPTESSLKWNDVLSNDQSKSAVKLEIGFSWKKLGELHIDQEGKVVFPGTPIGPAVYRFELNQNGSVEFYIGETVEISRRLQHYRTPGDDQQTNQRLNRLMRACLENGGAVGVAIAADGSVGDDVSTSNLNLVDKHQRKLIECAAIFAAKTAGQSILNK